jgi:uncharacterized protein YbjT (DUF2867 family)
VIAVVGAHGKTGRAVVAALRARGAPVLSLVRRASGANRERVVDLLDERSVTAAVDGVSAVYHLAPNVHPDEETIGRHVVDAAVAAGVERLVFHSVLHPQVSARPHHWAKLRVEERVLESGLNATVLQPAAYVQNLTVADGALRVPYDLDAPFSLVDLADVAQAAAVVLTEAGHARATYELAGPRAVTVREMAGVLGAHPERADAGEWLAGQDLTDYARHALGAMFTHYDRHGLVGNPRVLSMLLGRAPRDPADALSVSPPPR